MEPLKTYLTKKGWSKDWAKTRVFLGFRNRVKALETLATKLRQGHNSLAEHYNGLEGIQERHARFDDLEERSQKLDEVAEAIGDVQEFRISKWNAVAEDWTSRVRALEEVGFGGYKLVPKNADSSFEDLHGELVERAKDSTYLQLLNAAFNCGSQTLEYFDKDNRNVAFGSQSPLAGSKEYKLGATFTPHSGIQRSAIRNVTSARVESSSKGSYDLIATNDRGGEVLKIAMKHNLPESLENELLKENPELTKDVTAAYLIGLAGKAIATNHSGTMRLTSNVTKRDFERVLNLGRKMSESRLDESLLKSIVQQYPQLADYISK
jgi:hypothetical protein